jgi:hypothetical protein
LQLNGKEKIEELTLSQYSPIKLYTLDFVRFIHLLQTGLAFFIIYLLAAIAKMYHYFFFLGFHKE